jgi:tetratricopeptide (TPR) repeat protein
MTAAHTNSAHLPALLQEADIRRQQGSLTAAQALYEQILKLQPKNAEALNWLGVIAAQTGNPKKAVILFGKASAADPNDPVPLANQGLAYHEVGQFDAALTSFNRAIAVRGDYPDAFFNRANVLRDLDRLEEALASYDQAIAQRPCYPEAYSNRGIVLNELRRLEAAVASFDNAIALKPGLASAYFNRSYTFLLAGDFDNGLRDYEWRWKLQGASSQSDKRGFAQPLWLGQESIAGKTIVLHSEQGFGDTLQFCRYAPRVAGLGARVVLEVQASLVGLLSSLDGAPHVIARGAPLPPFDYHCPLMSLPLAFQTRVDTIAGAMSYLRSDPAKRAQWDARLGDRTRARVGLAWCGSATNRGGRHRSIRLADLIPHLPAGLQYVSLQKDLRDYDRTTLKIRPDILNFAAELKDFGDTAALCDCLDVVVTVDTSVAHLSGALGRQTWILLSFSPAWRWLLDRDDSPWYPTARLYRQRSAGDWSSVFSRIETELTRLKAQRASAQERALRGEAPASFTVDPLVRP